jgi:hypothetical protein
VARSEKVVRRQVRLREPFVKELYERNDSLPIKQERSKVKTIYKYPFRISNGFALDLPEGAKILTVQVQDSIPCLWAEVEVHDPGKSIGQFSQEPYQIERRSFRIFGTGHQIPPLLNLEYIGTVQINGLVWHIYEDVC